MDIVSNEIAHEYRVFDVRRLVVRAPRTGKPTEFYIIDRPDSVQVVAVTEDGKLLMVDLQRHGTQQASLEFVAGVLDADEQPVDCAARELEEETGYRAESIRELGWYFSDPAVMTSKVTIFLAEGCTSSGRQHLDEGEDIAVRLLDVSEVEKLIGASEITHGLCIAAWHLFSRRRGSGR